MKFDSRSADAFGQVDIVVNNAGIPNVAPLTAWHKDRPAAGRAAAMLAFAAGLLVAALGARAADEPARPQPHAERAVADSVRVQPTAKQFAPPNQPDVSASDASDIDKLYRQLIGPPPPTSSGSRSSTPPSGSAKR
jgi:NAD(P)-dependent dehydrogenase (short-subunit alcohol dehydrogenase family)